jgi:hypothetical protein
LDLTYHQHPGNRAAEHALVRQWLNLAVQQLGANLDREGELMVPVWDLRVGASHPTRVGSWAFIEDETHNQEAA